MAWRAAMGPTIQELRILLNPSATQSTGVTSFINNQYTFIKALNPSMPFLVRESSDSSHAPVIYARYAFGEERSRDVSNMSEKEVTEAVKGLLADGTTLPGIGFLPIIDGSPKDII
uniref:Ribosomal protein/NADH dehydrogenase domain-containing protein n=1 Tax=Hemiselmis andersenii TaxID=464988 RepID=A0A6T8GK86_HEMAN